MPRHLMLLEPHHIHIWSTNLATTAEAAALKLNLLSSDERDRAQRYHLPTHRQRYIAARSTLRQLLGHYLDVIPQSIEFAYTDFDKPFLAHTDYSWLQFNLAHCNDIALYAFTIHHNIGIDIERVKHRNTLALAQRYFSTDENAALKQYSEQQQLHAFYRLWSRKEALIKAAGKGLSIPLSSFTVAANPIQEIVILENIQWSILPLFLLSDYECALATDQLVKKISYFNFVDKLNSE